MAAILRVISGLHCSWTVLLNLPWEIKQALHGNPPWWINSIKNKKNHFSFFTAVLVAIGYCFGCLIGFAFTFANLPISVLWLCNAILLAGLLLTPVSHWWMIILSVLPVHFLMQMHTGIPALMAGAWFVSNCIEALVGATAVHYLLRQKITLNTYRHTYVFIGTCGILAPFVASFIDIAFVKAIGWGEGNFWQLWQIRFFSNVLAILAFVPVIISWAANKGAKELKQKLSLLQQFHFLIWLCGLLITSFIIFISEMTVHAGRPGMRQLVLFAPLMIMMWAAVIFNTFVVSIAFLTIALFAAWGVTHGSGPFLTGSPVNDALYVQLYLISTGVAALLLSGTLQERSLTHEMLKSKDEKLHLALASANMGTWEWNVATSEVEWSPESKAIFGFSEVEKMPNMNKFTSLIHPEDRNKTVSIINRALAGNGKYEAEYRIIRPDGQIRWLIAKGATIFNETGEPIRMIGLNVDITEKKHAEEKVRTAEEAKRVYLMELDEQRSQLTYMTRVAMLGELSGALAHELNQPLTAILSNAQAARRYLTSNPDNLQEIRNILEDIIEDNKRAAEVIRRLRAMFMKNGLKIEPLDINQLVRDTLKLAHSYLITHNVKVKNGLSPGIGWVKGDLIQLQQVLLNLIFNACEAMKNNSPHNRQMKIDTGIDSNADIWLAISDNGCGISDNECNIIFDSFYTTKETGMGFGLSISRYIIAEHGGKIEAKNNEDNGATFRVSLPNQSI